MVTPPSNQGNSLGAGGTPPANAIAIYQTNPAAITLHTIEDHELESLTNISRPISLGVAGTATGGLLSFMTPAFAAYAHLNAHSITPSDFASVCIFIICTVLSAVAWPYAISGQIKARRMLKSIRGRSGTRI